MFHVSILTIFPEMFPGPLQFSLAGLALKKSIWSQEVINIRDFGISKHLNVDDEAYGGGNGLIMRPDVLGNALDYAIAKSRERYNSANTELNTCHTTDTCTKIDSVNMPKNTKKSNFTPRVYYPSPRGKLLNQSLIKEIASEKDIIILCGRFEGVDERIIDEYNVTEISLGDYILSGGEIAALAMMDAIIRLLPGVLSNQDTLREESFEENSKLHGLLEYPLYTRPFEWRGRKVPDVLISGNHQKIAEWRYRQAQALTAQRRPDLIQKLQKLF